MTKTQWEKLYSEFDSGDFQAVADRIVSVLQESGQDPKPLKAPSFMDRIKRLKDTRITSIQDLPAENQQKMIESVLDAPCLPISISKLKSRHPSCIDCSKLSEEELDQEHALSPQFFIDLALTDPKLTSQIAIQANLNTMLARSYEYFVLKPDDMEGDGFREVCRTRYEDFQKIKESMQEDDKK